MDELSGRSIGWMVMLASLSARHRPSENAHRIERTAYLIAASLLTISFVLSIVIRTRSGQATRPTPGAASTP